MAWLHRNVQVIKPVCLKFVYLRFEFFQQRSRMYSKTVFSVHFITYLCKSFCGIRILVSESLRKGSFAGPSKRWDENS